MAVRTTIFVLLAVQGIYDLTLGGWLGILRWHAIERSINDAQLRLHAIYCHCQNCPDIRNCCCVPGKQVSSKERISQCDPADAAKVLNTWSGRAVSPANVFLLVPRRAEQFGYIPLNTYLDVVRIDHPPRA